MKNEKVEIAKQAVHDPAGPFPLFWGAATDAGKIRDENQDAFFIDPELALFLVSDGMGGHQSGAFASKIVSQVLPGMIRDRLEKLKSHSRRAIRSILKKTIAELNSHILTKYPRQAGLTGMGATLVMALLIEGRCFVANIGDSRLYLFRRKRLIQMTEDHSVIQELLRQGNIQPAESQNHPAKGQITRYIGIDEQANPYVRTLTLKSADRLLLCSDGLTDMLDDELIAKTLGIGADCHAACKSLVGAANAAGGHDNITVVIVDWMGRY